jgi:hypothetical protein
MKEIMDIGSGRHVAVDLPLWNITIWREKEFENSKFRRLEIQNQQQPLI